ncbi:hypothetical protein G7Y89_g4502 [Cudoniella acicularis]|uniref:Uncharacterized protein n=1 Tax=Cudoniella acicularis TaxID=354080 RepID=A0A8H4W4X2_9HELO|nr:hypothetical protein G7Y89_g4502 [Cudoniella acicularis]
MDRASQVDRLEQGGINTIGKEHFTALYSPVRKIVFTPKNIKAGFATSGLFPFNPDRVLRKLETPITPVSAEAFMSLQNLIIQRDAYALDETSKQNLARHLQKCTKAFQKSSTQSILQEDRIKFLTTINNEAKVRRATQSLVLGKAKVISYEDLEAARAKRTERDAAQEAKGKGKRGRKRKSTALEVEEDTIETARRGRKCKSAVLDAPELTNKIARISKALAPAGASGAQTSGTQVAEDEVVPEPWSALMARMY